MNLRDFLRTLKLELFHVRKSFLQYHNGWRYMKNRYFLSRKILRLKKILERPITHHDLSMHTMLGHKHVVMAVWALASFYSVSRVIGKLYLHSDRTLTKEDTHTLKKFFPSAEIVDPSLVLEEYSAKFNEHPRIKAFREKYSDNFFLTKFVDPYFVSDKKYRLFFDIDILWFQHPELIQKEIETGCRRSWMMKGTFSGGSEFNTVYFKDGSKLSEYYSSYNGGIMLFCKSYLNMKKVSDYFDRIDMTRKESRHWVEQAGYAYNLENLKYLPENEYIIKGPVGDTTIVKHYTGPRRVEFYLTGISEIKKRIMNQEP